MPPDEYDGRIAAGEFLELLASTLWQHRGPRLIATRANGQPAFGCYRQDPRAAIVRSYGLMVLTLEGDRISAVTWFGDRGLFPHFGLPRTLRE